MAEKQVLDARTYEVVRALPKPQTTEIQRYDRNIYQAGLHLEFGIFCVDRRYRAYRPSLLDTVIPRIARDLAWRSLELADGHGFPPFSPQQAMQLGRRATAMAENFATVTSYDASHMMDSAVGLTGLHFAIVGSTEIIENRTAQEILGQAEQQYRDEVVAPLSKAWNAERRSYER